MLTGKLDGISRAEAKSLIEENSGSIISNVSKKLDYLIIGEKPTRRKVETAKEMKIKNRKYFVIDFNNLLKKPLKQIVSSENAKRLAQSEIEKIIKFGLKSNDL